MRHQQPATPGFRPIDGNAAVVRKLAGVDDAGKQWALVFDSVLKEDINLPTKVTSEPVASGTPISDHAYDEQAKVTLTVVVSNVCPFDILDGKSLEEREAELGVEFGKHQIGDVLGDFFLEEGKTRSQVALARLDALRRSHMFCGLTLGLMSFQNMVLTNIHCISDEASAEVLQADLEFTQLTVTRVLVSTYPPRKDRAKGAAGKTKKGKAQIKTPTVAEQRQAYYQRLVSGYDGVAFDPGTAKGIAVNRYPLAQGETF